MHFGGYMFRSFLFMGIRHAVYSRHYAVYQPTLRQVRKASKRRSKTNRAALRQAVINQEQYWQTRSR